MSYTKQTWVDYNPLYPASAARFLHIEDGVYNATTEPSASKYGVVADAVMVRVTTNGTTTATLISSTTLSAAAIGKTIVGPTIAVGTTISNVVGTAVTLSQAAGTGTQYVLVGTDNTTALQAALDSMDNVSNRSNTLSIPAGAYLITSTLTITQTAGIEIAGAGDRNMDPEASTAAKMANYEGATCIYNGAPAGSPAILVQGSSASSGYGTQAIKIRRLSIKNLATNHGIKYDSASYAVDECVLEDVSIRGGDRCLWLTDSSGNNNGPWNFRCVRCYFCDVNGQQPNYGVYADSGTTLGVVSVFDNCTFRAIAVNGIYHDPGASQGASVCCLNCTFETCGKEAIYFIGGQSSYLRIIGGHAEQNFLTAYFNAGSGRYERANGDTAAAAHISVGKSGSNYSALECHIENFDANLTDAIASTDGVHMLALVSQWSGRLTIRDSFAGPSGGTTIQQPLVWTDGNYQVWAILDALDPSKNFAGNGKLLGGAAPSFFHGVDWNRSNDRPAFRLGTAKTSSGPTVFGGTGVPTAGAFVAGAGDFYFRTDTPGTANQRIYVCTAAGTPGAWSGIA